MRESVAKAEHRRGPLKAREDLLNIEETAGEIGVNESSASELHQAGRLLDSELVTYEGMVRPVRGVKRFTCPPLADAARKGTRHTTLAAAHGSTPIASSPTRKRLVRSRGSPRTLGVTRGKSTT